MKRRLPKAWPLLLLTLSGHIALAQSAGGKGDVPLGPPVQSTLPDLGSSANTVITKADEYQLGRMMMRDLRQENVYFDDPETTEFLQSVGSRIAVEAQDGGQTFNFFGVRDKSINAFALPGGFIGMNTGLITRTNSESELAGVMAHEIGHVVQRHIARAYVAQRGSSLTALAGLLGAVLIGAITGSADAGMGVMAVTQGAAMQQQINFTRMEESEADRVGINFLAESGFDPNGMAGFFSTIMRERGNELDEVPSLLLSHPLDQVRIAEARARIGAMPKYPRRPDSASYSFIRERVRVLASASDSDLRGYYENMRANDPRNPALVYGAALAEIKSGSPATAVTLLKGLVNEQPKLTLLHIALGQAQYAAGQKNDAVATYEKALAVSPRNVPLSVRYAESLLDMGRAKKAHQLLLDLFNVETPSPEQVKLIALAASAAGDTGDAYYYMSEYHISSGDLMLATQQLDLALASPNLTEIQRKRFQARREEIRGYLREQRNDRSGRAPPAG
jgi:predicted Zn-dependent protease